MKMRVGIVGCGLIGRRRAHVAAAHDQVLVVCDLHRDRAQALAEAVGAQWSTDWRTVVSRPDLDVIVVCTTNNELRPVVVSALATGKHVLCEKPLGRNAAEAAEMRDAAQEARRVLKVGFNHRHHPALADAWELAEEGAIGPLLCIRAAYGHGGRAGYEREWRGDVELAGGGELLDQGVHVIDLCRWFLGDFVEVSGIVATAFWSVEPLEDNAFALLRTQAGQIATIHTSWTQWKNLFRFEVFGRDGYLLVDGLGGSYGPERLTLGRRRGESGPPEETVWEFPAHDGSWDAEWMELTSALAEGRQPLGCADDGYEVMRLVDAIYRSGGCGAPIRVEAVA